MLVSFIFPTTHLSLITFGFLCSVAPAMIWSRTAFPPESIICWTTFFMSHLDYVMFSVSCLQSWLGNWRARLPLPVLHNLQNLFHECRPFLLLVHLTILLLKCFSRKVMEWSVIGKEIISCPSIVSFSQLTFYRSFVNYHSIVVLLEEAKIQILQVVTWSDYVRDAGWLSSFLFWWAYVNMS
jgi:hypothetical protein